MWWYLEVGPLGSTYVMKVESSWLGSVPLRDPTELGSPLSPGEDTVKRQPCKNKEAGIHQTIILILGFPAFRIVINIFLLFINHPFHGILLEQHEQLRQIFIELKPKRNVTYNWHSNGYQIVFRFPLSCLFLSKCVQLSFHCHHSQDRIIYYM